MEGLCPSSKDQDYASILELSVEEYITTVIPTVTECYMHCDKFEIWKLTSGKRTRDIQINRGKMKMRH